MRLYLRLILLILGNMSACIVYPDFNYKKWWDDRYAQGGTSGSGSRGILAQYKADIVNEFLGKHEIHSVVEFGCGDGYNLALMHYKSYVGFDVSETVIKMCCKMFEHDSSKAFSMYNPLTFDNKNIAPVDLVVCLDVLYHILDENEYLKVLDDMFAYSPKYIILYTTLHEMNNDMTSFNREVVSYLYKYSNYEIRVEYNKYPTLSSANWIFLTKKTS